VLKHQLFHHQLKQRRNHIRLQLFFKKIDKFEQELCRNDAVKGILDGKGKLKRVKRAGLGVHFLS
jgi:hypothetical protein